MTFGYEREINDFFSVSIEAGTQRVNIPYAEIKMRWYPWANTFFVELGSGIWGLTSIGTFDRGVRFSLPSVGWKINIGNKDRWVLIPGITHHVKRSFILYEPFWSVVTLNFFVGYKF